MAWLNATGCHARTGAPRRAGSGCLAQTGAGPWPGNGCLGETPGGQGLGGEVLPDVGVTALAVMQLLELAACLAKSDDTGELEL